MPVRHGFSHKNIVAAGTTNLKTNYGLLEAAHMSTPFVGTVEIYDQASGTSDATLVQTIGTPSAFPVTLNFHARMKNGITIVATGTPTVLITYD